MNIAILCHASAGGSGVVATELALALADLGHNIHVVALSRPFRLTEARLPEPNPGALESERRANNFFAAMLSTMISRFRRQATQAEDTEGGAARGQVQFHQIETTDYPLFDESLTTLTTTNALARLVAEHKIDIVHAHYAIPHATSATLARDICGGGFKVVTTLHGTDVTLVGLEPAFKATTRHAIRVSDAVTAVSVSLAEHTRDAFEFGAERPIHVIPNWVDTNRFKPNIDPAARTHFAQLEERILIHVSNFRSIKRPQDAVRIFAGVSSQIPARLLMVGDGPERAACVDLARELGVMGRVMFLDFLPEVETVMGLADLLLLPSEQESFGLVALEAMACGVPVVASAVGGLPEVIDHDKTGILVPVGDVEAMTAAALAVLSDDERRWAMGEAARARALQVFNPAVVLPKYLDVYRTVLGLETPVETPSDPPLDVPANEGAGMVAE